MIKTKNTIPSTIVKVCIILFFAICVIAPIVSMLCRITPEGFSGVVHSAQFSSAVFNSISTALVATVISLVLALCAAWCLERTAIKLKAFFSIVFMIPMLIPSISHAFGLVALLGTNGMITNLFGLNSSIYGFWGIVIGSVMYSFPMAFLMFSSILRYEDAMPYKAAEVLGVSAGHRFFDITIPYLKKTLISAFFAVFTMIITDYGVPLMIGGNKITLSVLMYNKAVAMIDYDSGSVIGAFLLIPAIIAFVVDLLNPENGQGSFVSESVVPQKKTVSDVLSYVFCILVGICVLAPIVSFCAMVFETKYPVNATFTLYHIQKTFNRGAGEYLLNSVMYAFLTAIFGTIIAFVCSYLTARLKGKVNKVLHLVFMTSMAIPGIVLGLSYVIFFSGSSIYGTVLIIALVNSIHFFASPYLMIYNTLGKVNPNLEDVGASLGVGKLRIILDVIVPKVKYTLYEMFVYFFVNSMMTISAVSFLAPPAPKPIALMINQFEAQLLMESAAFVSLVIFVINFIIKIIMERIKYKNEIKENKAV